MPKDWLEPLRLGFVLGVTWICLRLRREGLSSVGFGLSPAVGRAIRDLVVTGACTFADLSIFRLSRFAALEADWRSRQGWLPIGPGASAVA